MVGSGYGGGRIAPAPQDLDPATQEIGRGAAVGGSFVIYFIGRLSRVSASTVNSR